MTQNVFPHIIVLVIISATTHHVTCVKDYVDLSYWLTESIPMWPGNKPYNLTIIALRGFGPSVGQTDILEMSTHFGTHIDAPVHAILGKWTLDQIPEERLRGPGVMVDVENKVNRNSEYQVTKADILMFEEKHGQIPPKGIVLFKTGWGKRWNSTKDFMGTDSNDVRLLSFPGLSKEGAEFLVNQRDIVGIGFDTCSYDAGSNLAFHSHVLLSNANKWGLENVANLERLPAKGFDVYIFPIKLLGASGGPARVVAFLSSP